LVGGAFASIPGVAWAANGGNRECVRCCKETYGPGRERGQCISAGARGECPVTCDGNGGGECPPGSLLPPAVGGDLMWTIRGRGRLRGGCLYNVCTNELTCVCCPVGGPCPCVPIPDHILDPCITMFSSACPEPEACTDPAQPNYPFRNTFSIDAGVSYPCPGPHNPECGQQSEICVGPM
jgi:hypothetical protein